MIIKADDLINERLINSVCERLEENKTVSLKLPYGGMLYIDRKLPFLCLYRMPPEYEDCGTEKLITGEASYLIASGHKLLHKSLSSLVLNIIKTLSPEFGAYLLLEIWASREEDFEEGEDTSLKKPVFYIAAHKNRSPYSEVQTLERELRKIELYKKAAEVKIVQQTRIVPHGLPQIISSAEAQALQCYLMGLEIKPIYRNWETGQIFPIVIRRLHRQLEGAFKQTFFEFVRTYTIKRPANYQALGKRATVKAVWEIDQKLAEISDTFDFLLQSTPVNADKEWLEMKRRHFEHTPIFHYRPVPVEPALLKRKLYNIPIERIEDPTLGLIFREKRRELDRQITMLIDRDSRKFLYGSLQLYGGVDNSLFGLARDILESLPPRIRNGAKRGYVKAEELAGMARAEIEYYKSIFPDISAKVYIREDVSSILVSRGNLLIGCQTKVPAMRVEALLHHEVGTHIVTYVNGNVQPFHLLHAGFAGYEELQEGLAIVAEYLVGGLNLARFRLIAARVIAVKSMIDGASFVETFRLLNKVHGFEQRLAYSIAMRVYRGGGLTKDAIYFRGFFKLLEYLKNSGSIEPLFMGKIALNHVPVIQELQSRHILKPLAIMPRYMGLIQTEEKLKELCKGFSIPDLIIKTVNRKKERK